MSDKTKERFALGAAILLIGITTGGIWYVLTNSQAAAYNNKQCAILGLKDEPNCYLPTK